MGFFICQPHCHIKDNFVLTEWLCLQEKSTLGWGFGESTKFVLTFTNSEKNAKQ
jgi:hypothetical protein